MKILLADDEAAGLKELETLLRPVGEITAVRNGSAAVAVSRLALERGQPFQLILLDIDMPGFDGRFALRGIRKIEAARGVLAGQGARVVMTAARDDRKAAVSVFREQADGLLVRPVQGEQLHRVLSGLGIPLPQKRDDSSKAGAG